jgi:hypothetical protein
MSRTTSPLVSVEGGTRERLSSCRDVRRCGRSDSQDTRERRSAHKSHRGTWSDSRIETLAASMTCRSRRRGW